MTAKKKKKAILYKNIEVVLKLFSNSNAKEGEELDIMALLDLDDKLEKYSTYTKPIEKIKQEMTRDTFAEEAGSIKINEDFINLLALELLNGDGSNSSEESSSDRKL